jgi:hypothetical protein
MGGGTFPLGGPATSHLWVVRHVTATAYVTIPGVLKGFTLSIGSLGTIWTLGGIGIAEGQAYQWSGRHVVNDGEQLEFVTADPASPGWTVVASGFDLQTP